MRLAKLNKPEVPVILLGSLAAIIHGVVFPVFGLLFSSAVDTFFKPPERQRKESRLWSLLYVGLGLVTLVVLPLQNYFFAIAVGKLIERVRSSTLEKIVHQEIRWFDDPANSRVLAVFPMVLMQGVVQIKFIRGFSAGAKVMYEEASQVEIDVVSSIRTVASFCAESKVMDMYRKKCLRPEIPQFQYLKFLTTNLILIPAARRV
ncbi:hypothetical protein KIW84_055129 [Lathyrus oleraceus]|uniref:ABC transmembrane type-1 domain-containing protein n=1 Tax=Pisum sativum TaxID=3888 RepID=A0A9D5AJE1_PEA|nr:hypothetical protein KIW84_055129 [Pisum sativum]